ncbi:MAG: helicase-related protein, partial [Candidatus Woesebacteria bacterium]|nr:helicase-related protein [Candidatus Woesebacteria bacterium]
HPDNKIVLLTATPFNNDPKDVFALIKLFQTPGQSTIRSIDNLSLRYRDLIQRYKKLRREMSKGLAPEEIDKEASEIATEQRRLIEAVIIRRSRLDLDYITRYKEDLRRQNISFAEVKGGGPELLSYDLNGLQDLYVNTLNTITDDKQGFVGARYKPTAYILGKNRDKFIDTFKNQIEDASDLWIAQSNLAKFMRRLLVMRFESSRAAFRSTLDKMIESNERIENWWDNLGKVPIMKKGRLPDPQDYDLEDGEESNALEFELEFLRNKEGFLEVPKEMLDPEFITVVRNDTALLKKIKNDWYSDPRLSVLDPKLEEVAKRIRGFLSENPNKKIVIFSIYKDTVDYLYEKLKGELRIFKYTATDSTAATRQEVKENFDASMPDNKQKNDYDVLVATDALSEGYNLHRAGIVINYDIPYNPTRVIQRVGRINRINKRMFDFLEVYNCFPTDIGEEEVRVKSISTLKMKLINAVVGSDMRTLTKDEELVSYFKDEYAKAEKESERLSWDAPHRQAYDTASKDKDLMNKVLELPRRARIKRTISKENVVSVFGKKGSHAIFTIGLPDAQPKVTSAEDALNYFVANPDEKGEAVDKEFTGAFNLAKDKLFAKNELPKIQGRRATAITTLKAIGESLPQATDYCEDVIAIIKDLDDVSDGVLKDISQLDLRNVEEAYKRVLELVPLHFIQSIQERAGRFESEKELLLFAEQFK